MTYQTAYKLLVAAYKSAKGVMPQGIDMLKLKMKARQKVIDAKKVIKVNFDKGNNWMKAKPQSTKGKVAETEAEMIVRMNRQNKESVARLKEKKEKSLGEKLRDYDGDPDGMAAGGIAKLMSKGIKTALKRTRKGYDTPGADFQVLTEDASYLMSPPNMQMLEKLKIVRRQLVRDIKRKEGGGKYTFGPDPKATKKDLQSLDEYIADLKDKIKVEGYYGKGAEAEKSLLKSDPLLPFSKLVKDKYRNAEGGIIGYGSGGKVKKPFKSKVVDFLGGPAVVGAELGLSGLLEVYNLLGMPLMKDGGKVKKKRKHNDNIDDEDIGEGKSKERFLRVMPQASDIPRSDGIMELATGGMTNIGDTYDNNPTLQSQYPNKQDYLDLFAQQTTTTPQYATAYQSTGSIDPINPILPIIPIPQSDGDGGGGPPPGPKGNPKFDYEYNALGGLYNKDNVPLTEEEQKTLNIQKAKTGVMNVLSLNPKYQMSKFIFNKVKAGAAATKKTIDDYFAKKAAEKAAKEKEINRIQQIIDSGSSVDKATGGQFGTSVNEPTSRGGKGFSDYT